MPTQLQIYLDKYVLNVVTLKARFPEMSLLQSSPHVVCISVVAAVQCCF